MIKLRSTTFALLLCGAALYACQPTKADDDDDDDSSAGTATTAGKAGADASGPGGASEGGADASGVAGSDAQNEAGAGGDVSEGGVAGGDNPGSAGSDPGNPGSDCEGTVVWKEDFENGAPDWSVSGGVWAVGAVTNPAGPQAFAGKSSAGTGLTADYGASHNAILVSPEIDVPAAKEHPRFRLRYWYELAAGDYGYVLVRVDGGGWQTLSTLEGSGDGSWRHFMYDLGKFADRTVQLGVQLQTNSSSFGPGLFVDDAAFETGARPFAVNEGFEDDWGCWSAYGGVWAIGKPTAADGPTAPEGESVAGTILSGDYPPSTNATLISPHIAVPAALQEPRISFKYWYDLSTSDSAYLFLRADGGAWQTVFELDESGDGSWRDVSLPLAAYADRTIELGFQLSTNSTAQGAGFYVDDVRYETGPAALSTAQGFEDGFDGWSAYGGVWAVGEPTAADGPEPHGGTALAGTILSGDYGSGDRAILVTPKFMVPAGSAAPSMSYWYWYELAAGDAAYTLVRVNGGAWQTLNELDQSGGDMWRKQTIDLTPYKNKLVEIGFQISTNSTAFAPGYYIDDVSFALD